MTPNNDCPMCGEPAEVGPENNIFGEPDLICRNKDCFAGQPKQEPDATEQEAL